MEENVDSVSCVNCEKYIPPEIDLFPWYYYPKNWVDLGLLILLVIGSYLIYRKHKGEEGLLKKVVKWELIFILILSLLWIVLVL